MPKIETLTSEQWEAIAAVREDWRAVGLCTDPADRCTTEEVISGFYRRIGHEPPKFVWFDGPLSCCVLGPLVHQGQLDGPLVHQLGDLFKDVDQFWNQIPFREELWGKFEGPLGAQIEGQLGDQIEGQLKQQFESQLFDPLRDQLSTLLRGLLRDPAERVRWTGFENQLGSGLASHTASINALVREQIHDLFEKSGKKVLNATVRSADWCWWVAHYIGCRDVVGLSYTAEQSEFLDQWARLLRSSGGWWFPFKDVCFLAERHQTLVFDEDRRLHSEEGPAIVCRDGFRVYAWHGTRVPAEWIEDRASLTPETALTWENVEQRQAAAELVGWDRVLETLDARLIDEDPDPQVGRLVEVDLLDAPGSRFIIVRCGTGRTFALPVPDECTTALGANAWTYGIEPIDLLNLEVRT